jgi:hypothetical protein
MYIALERRCLAVSLAMPAAQALSVWIGVVGFGCLISMRTVRRGMASQVLWNNAPNSAYVAEAIALAMMALIVWMAPLYACGGGLGGFMGSAGFAIKKKVPPSRLRSLDSAKYEASL